jgi:hypothetical protein
MSVDDHQLHPQYPLWAPYGVCAVPHVLTCAPTFSPTGRYPVVDAGSGTAAELAAAGVKGKLALIHEAHDPQAFWPGSYAPDTLIADAAKAGATGVLYAVGDPGAAERWLRGPAPVPSAVLTLADGSYLARALRSDDVKVRTGGQPLSPYVYDLLKVVTALPAQPVFRYGEKDLARVDARYHADQKGATYADMRYGRGYLAGVARQTMFPAPFTRTEYLTPGVWEHWLIYSPNYTNGHETHQATYTAGSRLTEDHIGTPMVPVPDNASASTYDGSTGWLFLTTSPFTLKGGLIIPSDYPPDGAIKQTYSRDGQVVCTSTLISGCEVSPALPGRYQVVLDVNQWLRPVSTRTHTVWENDVAFAHGVNEKLTPISPEYDVPVDLMNAMRAGSRIPLTVTPAYPPGTTGPGSFSIHAWASYDGGTTWTDLGSRKGSRGEFEVTAPAHGADFVTTRVRIEDGAGSTVDQIVTNAWHITPR